MPEGEQGSPATVGINAGDGVRAVNVTGTNTNNVINIENTTNIGVPGVWVFQVNGAEGLGNVFIARYTYIRIRCICIRFSWRQLNHKENLTLISFMTMIIIQVLHAWCNSIVYLVYSYTIAMP